MSKRTLGEKAHGSLDGCKTLVVVHGEVEGAGSERYVVRVKKRDRPIAPIQERVGKMRDHPLPLRSLGGKRGNAAAPVEWPLRVSDGRKIGCHNARSGRVSPPGRNARPSKIRCLFQDEAAVAPSANWNWRIKLAVLLADAR